MAAVAKTLALPIALPLAMTIVFMTVPVIANYGEQNLGISKVPSGFAFFKSKQGWATFGLLFTIMFLFAQLFIIPMTGVGPQMGKLTRISPKQVPAMLFKFFLFGYLPLIISNMFVGLSGEKVVAKQLMVKRLGLCIGFFLVTFIMQSVKMVDIILTILLYMVLSTKGVLEKMLKLFGTTMDTGKTAFAQFMIFLFVFGLVTTGARYVPFHSTLADKVDAKIGLFGDEGAKGAANYAISVGLLLMLPMAIAASLESLTQKMGTLKAGGGTNLGYIIGVMVGLLIQNITGKTVQLS